MIQVTEEQFQKIRDALLQAEGIANKHQLPAFAALVKEALEALESGEKPSTLLTSSNKPDDKTDEMPL